MQKGVKLSVEVTCLELCASLWEHLSFRGLMSPLYVREKNLESPYSHSYSYTMSVAKTHPWQGRGKGLRTAQMSKCQLFSQNAYWPEKG